MKQQSIKQAFFGILTLVAAFSANRADAQHRTFRPVSAAVMPHHHQAAVQHRPVHHAPAPRVQHNAPQNNFLVALRQRAEQLARQGLPYVFGGSSPAQGGMDCSGTMMHLFSGLGVRNIPRTSYQQYEWLNAMRTIRHTKTIPASAEAGGLKPGDLIFWGGTYNSGHKVSHVMLYLGQGPDGRHYMFGAKGKKSRGMNGSGVDIFELRKGYHKGLVGYGHVPR